VWQEIVDVIFYIHHNVFVTIFTERTRCFIVDGLFCAAALPVGCRMRVCRVSHVSIDWEMSSFESCSSLHNPVGKARSGQVSRMRRGLALINGNKNHLYYFFLYVQPCLAWRRGVIRTIAADESMQLHDSAIMAAGYRSVHTSLLVQVSPNTRHQCCKTLPLTGCSGHRLTYLHRHTPYKWICRSDSGSADSAIDIDAYQCAAG